jgi:PPP family 3-phenylpropionic acid transporter
LLFSVYGFAIGVLLPWNVLQLTEAGLEPASIGLVLGVAAFASLVAYPVWGLVADLLLDRDRTLMVTGLLAALAGLGMIAAADRPELLAAFIVAAIVATAPWAPVSDALALAVLGTHPRAYGRLRVFTSAGWIGASLSGGVLYAWGGPQPVRTLFVLASLAVPVVLAARRSRQSILRRGRPAGTERIGRAALRAAVRASPVFLPFLGVLFVSSLATNAAYSFISLRILDEGGGPLLIGLASAVPALVEMPVFGVIGLLAARFGLRALFVAGCLLSAAQSVVVALAPQPGVIALVRLADGAGFALRYSSIVLITGAALPERLRATGQSLAWLVVGGIAPIVSGPAAGLVYGGFGGAALFVGCALLLTIAAAIAWVVLAPLRSAPARVTAEVAGTD